MCEPPRQKIVTSEGRKINLEDEIGASISVPRDAIVEDEKVDIAAGFSLPYEMPDGVESVSPAVLIKTKRNVEFTKDVDVKLQHHANIKTAEDCKDMLFLEASVNPTRGSDLSQVYMFEEMKGTEIKFKPGERSGMVKLKRLFSWLKIGRKKRERHKEGIVLNDYMWAK